MGAIKSYERMEKRTIVIENGESKHFHSHGISWTNRRERFYRSPIPDIVSFSFQ